MKKQLIVLLMFMGIMGAKAQMKADFKVVPLPNRIVENTKGSQAFPLGNVCTIVCPADQPQMVRNAHFLAEYLKQQTELTIPVNAKLHKGDRYIKLALNKKITAHEGYRIKVEPTLITIEGNTPQGVFYGIQTLRKALPIADAGQIEIPLVTIDDAPRFKYRGMHLDVGRHFFSIDFVKRYIDILALHNVNTFHWHLTEDQGWRMEIKKYPRLTEIGAWRKGTVIGRNTGIYDHRRHGGFYTQEECREIVKYAQERYITVIPEIDMPGHMIAALAAYPELGCTGGPYEVERMWGVFDDILCAGKEETFKFATDVLDEVMQVFPSEYIHIGGDEAPRTRWKACPKCQKRIADEGLRADGKHSAEDYLQSYFTKRIEQYVNSKGRKIIGWDEILEGEIAPSATIQSWREVKDGLRAAEQGHDVFFSPNSTLYFDFYQYPETNWSKPLLIGGCSTLEHVYAFEPCPENISEAAKNHIIGVQGNLWTEYIKDEELAEYQVLPRMGAAMETGWTQPEKKNYSDFKNRQHRLFDIYRLYGWKYCTEAWRENK